MLVLAFLAILPSPAFAQREGADLGEGFVAKVTRLAQEHPVETVAVSTGSSALAVALAAAIRELNRRKKEGQDRG